MHAYNFTMIIKFNNSNSADTTTHL